MCLKLPSLPPRSVPLSPVTLPSSSSPFPVERRRLQCHIQLVSWNLKLCINIGIGDVSEAGIQRSLDLPLLPHSEMGPKDRGVFNRH